MCDEARAAPHEGRLRHPSLLRPVHLGSKFERVGTDVAVGDTIPDTPAVVPEAALALPFEDRSPGDLAHCAHPMRLDEVLVCRLQAERYVRHRRDYKSLPHKNKFRRVETDSYSAGVVSPLTLPASGAVSTRIGLFGCSVQLR